MSRSLLILGTLSVSLYSAIFLVPNIVSADTPLVANTSVSNVAEVKATRTITVASVPTVPVVLTIGICAVTVTANGTSDINCTDNTALIATTTDTTTSLIASKLRTLTNVSDTGHGALTVGGSGATASFTTTGTEASATAVTATQSAGTNFTLATVNTTGVVPVAQTTVFNLSTTDIAGSYTITINSRDYTYNFPGGLLQSVATALTSSLASDSAATCTIGTFLVSCVSKTAGTSFTAGAASTPIIRIVPPTSTRRRTSGVSSISANAAAAASAIVAPAVTPVVVPPGAQPGVPASGAGTSGTGASTSKSSSPTSATSPATAPAPTKSAPAPAPTKTKGGDSKGGKNGAAVVGNDAAAIQALTPPVPVYPPKSSWFQKLKNLFR